MREEIIEILVEELSMKNFLSGILPKILPDGFHLNDNCFIREHEGKQHLKKSIPKKVKAYQNSSRPVKVIVIQDQDSSNCSKLKLELQNLVDSNSTIPCLIRIACRELESWYLGDLDALEKVYPQFKANKYKNWAKFRNPDLCNASYEIKRLIDTFQKGVVSKEITQYLDLKNNRSTSFKHLVSGICKFLN
jgi:hypothetical protein